MVVSLQFPLPILQDVFGLTPKLDNGSYCISTVDEDVLHSNTVQSCFMYIWV